MYAANTSYLFKFKFNNKKDPITWEFFEKLEIPHIKNEYKDGKLVISNSGIAIMGNYVLVGRYYKGKKNSYINIDNDDVISNNKDKIKNIINIYEFNDTDDQKKLDYKATYVFDGGERTKDNKLKFIELENICVSKNKKNYLTIAYNGTNEKDGLYYLDLSKLNSTKFNVKVSNKLARQAGSIKAVLYKHNGKTGKNAKYVQITNKVSPTKLNNLIIKNLSAGQYKLVITKNSQKTSKTFKIQNSCIYQNYIYDVTIK